MTSTARCGSTLLCQAFEKTGRCLALSEPLVLNNLAARLQEDNRETLEHLTRSVINILCKPVKGYMFEAFALKIAPASTNLLKLLINIYPDAAYIHMYRDVVKVAQSWYRIVPFIPLYQAALIVGYVSSNLKDKIMDQCFIPNEWQGLVFKTPLDQGVILWCASMKYYLECKRFNSQLCCITYEDLMVNPIGLMKNIMRHIGLPEKFALSIYDAMGIHSQKISSLANQIHNKAPSLTLARKERINNLLSLYGLPKLGERLIVPGIVGLDQ